MEIEQALQLKKELESDILSLLLKFESVTHLYVENMDINRLRVDKISMDRSTYIKGTILSVKIKVELI